MATSEYQVKIEVDNGVIVCNVKDGKVKGGNVVVRAVDTNTIHFIGNGVKFGLSFVTFPDGATVWPFVGDPPSSWPVPEFKGVLKPVGSGTYYKYGVSVVGAAPLDPIIIVDK